MPESGKQWVSVQLLEWYWNSSTVSKYPFHTKITEQVSVYTKKTPRFAKNEVQQELNFWLWAHVREPAGSAYSLHIAWPHPNPYPYTLKYGWRHLDHFYMCSLPWIGLWTRLNSGLTSCTSVIPYARHTPGLCTSYICGIPRSAFVGCRARVNH